ncbi:hypothetical protein [Brachyspira pilosicoli]|uniref:hypothetical protein n=1 Tax=Brachyspira pilosicoli TaxID=52584 RepID=UPI003460FD78
MVCTNPPFSRAIDYWNIVIGSGKKFLIISNITNCKNDKYIPYFIILKNVQYLTLLNISFIKLLDI